jgi:thiol-disulfide isomerase/thioredoxin
MKKILLLIYIVFFAINSYSIEKNAQAKVKIRKLDNILRVPSDIAFFDEDNNKYYLEEFEGKTIILAFWATWCAPCIKELPELDILKRDFKKLPVEIIAMSEDFQGPAIVKDFYRDNEINNLKIYHDYGNALFRSLNVTGLPSTFIIDPDGVILAILEGVVNWNSENMREMLLGYIPGNPVMPKNSAREGSLNQKVKTPLKNDDKTNATPNDISASNGEEITGEVEKEKIEEPEETKTKTKKSKNKKK